MLKRKELVIYLTIVFTFLIGVFIFVPAVAVQKPAVKPGDLFAQAKDGKDGSPSPDESETDINGIMKVLEDRERDLSKREEALKKEEVRLNMLKNSIELSLKQYSTMRDKTQKGAGESRQTDGLAHMAKIYEAMSVEEAAQRIEKMDADLAVKLLTVLKSKQAGKILGAIPAERAASLSSKIASKKVEK